MGQRIVHAIRHRRFTSILLEGCDYYVEPHAYGLDWGGHAILVCYQIGEAPFGGDPARWKNLRLLDATSVKDCQQDFAGPRSGYVRNNQAFHTIFAQL